MKKLILLFIFVCGYSCAAHAACPDGFEEIPMENMTLTESGGSCSGDNMSYYQIDDLCNANIQ